MLLPPPLLQRSKSCSNTCLYCQEEPRSRLRQMQIPAPAVVGEEAGISKQTSSRKETDPPVPVLLPRNQAASRCPAAAAVLQERMKCLRVNSIPALVKTDMRDWIAVSGSEKPVIETMLFTDPETNGSIVRIVMVSASAAADPLAGMEMRCFLAEEETELKIFLRKLEDPAFPVDAGSSG